MNLQLPQILLFLALSAAVATAQEQSRSQSDRWIDTLRRPPTGAELPAERKTLLDAIKTLEAANPDDIQLAEKLQNLASISLELNDLSMAQSSAFRSVTIYEKNLRRDHPSLQSPLFYLGESLRLQQNFKEAQPYLLRAYEIQSMTEPQSQSQNRIIIMDRLGEAYMELGNYNEADEFYRGAYVTASKRFGGDHERTALAEMQICRNHARFSDFDKAASRFDSALENLEKLYGKTDPRLIEFLDESAAMWEQAALFDIAADQNAMVQALERLKSALQIDEAAHGKNLYVRYCNLGSFHARRKNFSAAETAFQKAVSLVEVTANTNPGAALDALTNFGRVFRKQRKFNQAEVQLKRARPLCQKPDISPDLSCLFWDEYGALLRQMGKLDEAAQCDASYLSLLPSASSRIVPRPERWQAAMARSEECEVAHRNGSLFYLATALEESEGFGEGDERLYDTLVKFTQKYRDENPTQNHTQLYARAARLLELVKGKESPELAQRLLDLAETSPPAEAMALCKRAVAIYEAGKGNYEPELGQALARVAELHYKNSAFAEAEQLFKVALSIGERNFSNKCINTSAYIDTLRKINRAGEIPALEERFNTLEVASKNTSALINATSWLSNHHGSGKSYTDEHAKSLMYCVDRVDTTNPRLENAYSALITHYDATGRYADEIFILKRQIKLVVALRGENHADVALLSAQAGDLNVRMGLFKEARLQYLRALEIRKSRPGMDEKKWKLITTNATALLRTMGLDHEIKNFESTK
jgi:tetratricopeptide (TPR) repeat protein